MQLTSIPVTMGTLNKVRKIECISTDAANTTPIPTLKIPLEAWTAWRHTSIYNHTHNTTQHNEWCLKVSYGTARRSLLQKVVQNRFDSRQRFTGAIILHQRRVIWTSAVCRILVMLNIHLNMCAGHLKWWNDSLKISTNHKHIRQTKLVNLFPSMFYFYKVLSRPVCFHKESSTQTFCCINVSLQKKILYTSEK